MSHFKLSDIYWTKSLFLIRILSNRCTFIYVSHEGMAEVSGLIGRVAVLNPQQNLCERLKPAKRSCY